MSKALVKPYEKARPEKIHQVELKFSEFWCWMKKLIQTLMSWKSPYGWKTMRATRQKGAKLFLSQLSLFKYWLCTLAIFSCSKVLIGPGRAAFYCFFLFLVAKRLACHSLFCSAHRAHTLWQNIYKNNRMCAARNFPQHKEKIGAFILACVPRDVCVYWSRAGDTGEEFNKEYIYKKNALGSEEALACLSHPCVGASYFVITFPAAPVERKLAQNPAVVAANMLYEIKQQRTAAAGK